MTRPPPTSPLFPYTTLFRSPTRAGRRARIARCHRFDRRAGAGRSTRTGWRDRKSTRLNSSHVRNSYAVFCLKKKKKAEHSKVTAGEKHEEGVDDVQSSWPLV